MFFAMIFRYDVSEDEPFPPDGLVRVFRDAVGLGGSEDMHAYLVVVLAVVVGYVSAGLVSVPTGGAVFTAVVAGALAMVLFDVPTDAVVRALSGPVSGTPGAPRYVSGSGGAAVAAASSSGGPNSSVGAVEPPLDGLERCMLLHEFPPWASHPDAEKSEWFNDMLELLWPTLGPAVERAVVDGVEWALAGAPLDPHLLQFSLGRRPPAVTAVKCYPQTVS